MEDRDKVHELLVLINITIELRDSGRVGIDIFRDGRLRLEETLKGSLTKSHLLELGLLLTLLGLRLSLESFLGGTSAHCVHHGFKIHSLTSESHIGLLEGVLPFFDVFLDRFRQLSCNRVRKDALGAVAITVGIDSHILEVDQVLVDLLVVSVRRIVVRRESRELLNLFL